MRLNRPLPGFIIGLLAPMLGFIVVFLILGHGVSLSTFMDRMAESHSQAAMILSLCLIANGICFLLFTNSRLDYGARGVFIATMLYAMLYVFLKWIW